MREKLSADFKKLKDLNRRGKVKLLVYNLRSNEDLLTNWADHMSQLSSSYLFPILRTLLGLFDWALIVLTVFLVWKLGWIYLLIMLVVILFRRKIFDGIGSGFIIYNCWKSERFFDLMWKEGRVMLEFDGKKIGNLRDWRTVLEGK